MDGGHLVAETLDRADAPGLFTLCGGHVMNIYDGCLDRDIPVIDVRHEQAAVMAADGVARLTGEPGVAVVTAGPGVTNAMTGFENAKRCDSPVITIGGQGPLEDIDRGSLQESDHLGFVDAATTWSRRIHDTQRLGEYVERAYRHATSLPMGPTFLEAPWDVLFGDTATEAPADVRTRPPRSLADPEAIREAVDVLEAANRPAIVASGGVRWGEGVREVRDLVELTGIPGFQNGLGRGTFGPDVDDAYHLTRGSAFKRADAVLSLTMPWDFRTGFGDKVADDATIIQAAQSGERAGENKACDLALVGHTGAICEQLLAEAKGRSWTRREDWHGTIQGKEAEKMESVRDVPAAEAGVSAIDLVDHIAPYVEDDALFIGDGGNIVATAAKILRPTEPEHWLDTGPFGCLGVGPPFAIAANVVFDDETPLVLEGDGSFGLNGMEIETLARHDMGAVFVLANDAAWNQIRVPQLQYYGEERAVATDLASTRYDEVAEGMGAEGIHVREEPELPDALQEAWRIADDGVPVVVNVDVDPNTNAGTGGYPA
ncbi:acetolactate synthase [Thermoplasmatales archaeon SW_10_69_26]|nr:MAG: acetolactate synthase [Thermoplasmatales archaeon SW_10_69_26]